MSRVRHRRWLGLSLVGDLLLILALTRGVGLSVGWTVLLVESLAWGARLAVVNPALLHFVVRRLLAMVPVVFIVIALGFALVQLAPGDAFSQMSLDPNVRPADLDRLREQFGLDRPWYVQFVRYVVNVLQGNFGFSQTYKVPVFALVQQRAAATVLLSGLSLIVAWGMSIPFGVIAATHQYRWQDQIISVLAFVGLAIPNFFLAFLLLYFVTTTSTPPGTWLPLGGMTSMGFDDLSILGKTWDLARHLVIPVFVIATSAMANLTRVMRARMLDALSQPYIITARAKGQRERVVVFRHALRNAINPMITILGYQIGAIMAGSALVEIVLAWPGLGQLILEAVLTQDQYLVVGSLIYSVVLLVIGNLLADILLAITDPRIRLGGA